MVATLLRLKVTLWKRGLSTTPAILGLVFGLTYALFIVVGWAFLLVTGREAGPGALGAVTVVGAAAYAVLWLLASVLFFGSDETLDPARFATLPLTPRDLLPGLTLATLVGVPGAFAAAVALPVIVVWGLVAPWLALVAAVGVGIGALAAVLTVRAVTSAMARGLSSRRSRDATAVVLALVGGLSGVGFNALTRLFDVSHLRLDALSVAAGVLAWTPLGAGWALPGDAAAGAWALFAGHLIAALAWPAVLAAWWARVVGRALTETAADATSATVAAGGPLDRLAAHGLAAAVAARCLRYWRRDPRYISALASLLVMPAILLVPALLYGTGLPVRFVVGFVGVFAVATALNDTSLDGSALWLHVVTGVPGRADRAGRVAALLLVALLPAAVVTGIAVWAQGWARLPGTLGLLAVTLLAGAGIGTWIGARYQSVVAQPGENAFARRQGGGVTNLGLGLGHAGATLLVAAPVIALAWFDATPAFGWAALAAGVLLGAITLVIGVRAGGATLDRRWPEALAAITPAG